MTMTMGSILLHRQFINNTLKNKLKTSTKCNNGAWKSVSLVHFIYKTLHLENLQSMIPSTLLCLPDILLCFWSFPHCQAWRAGHPLCHFGHRSLWICLRDPVRKYKWVACSFCTISCKEKESGKQPPKRKVRWQQLDQGPGGLASAPPDRCLSVRSQGRRWQQIQARLTHLLLRMRQSSLGWASVWSDHLFCPQSSIIDRLGRRILLWGGFGMMAFTLALLVLTLSIQVSKSHLANSWLSGSTPFEQFFLFNSPFSNHSIILLKGFCLLSHLPQTVTKVFT